MCRLHKAFWIAALLTFAWATLGFVYEDPQDLYAITIPDGWVYQAHHSTDNLTVFYGAGEDDLLYFELLFFVEDEDSLAFAQRSLGLFGGPGGLLGYKTQEPPTIIDVGGLEAAASTYSYQGDGDKLLWEERLFIILPGKRGFSITLSDHGGSFLESRLVLEELVQNWRWLF